MLHHYHVRTSSTSTTLNRLTGKPFTTRPRAYTAGLPEDLGAASPKTRTSKAKKAKALKKREEKEDEDFLDRYALKDDDMASSFLQYCTVCDMEIRVPDNTILYCSESCRRKDSLPTSPSTPSLTPHLQFHKRPEVNRILSVHHTGKSDPDPTEWKPSDPEDASEWKPPKIFSSGRAGTAESSDIGKLSKTTGDLMNWKPKLPHRGGSDAYKYLSGFHTESPKLGSPRSSANASRTSLVSMTSVGNIANDKSMDLAAIVTSDLEKFKFRTAGGGITGTCTTTRSAPSLSHTPITSTDDEDSSLASTPISGSSPTKKCSLVHGGSPSSCAVSSTSGGSSHASSSINKNIRIVTAIKSTGMGATTAAETTAEHGDDDQGLTIAIEPPTPCSPLAKTKTWSYNLAGGGITDLRAAKMGEI